MSYDGSCHCGAVAFTVSGDLPTTAVSCNCSHCRRKGFLWSFGSADRLTVTAGGDALVDYRFNKRALAHLFCPSCGCQPFAKGKGPDGSAMAAVNLRCVPAVDLDALEVKQVDGASF